MEEEQTLEYWCDMMVKTYNTSILDNFPTSLKRSLQEEAKQCVESKPNPNSYTDFFGLIKRKKNRNVLMRLINNYFRSKQVKTTPTVDFIGGPHTLTLHWSSKYNKIIYIFGEVHRKKVCNYDNMMLVENYLKRLFRVSSAFIDFFLEIPMFIKGKYKDFDFNSRMNILRNQNIKCIESSQRQENRECDTKRIHFISIKQGPKTEEEIQFFKLNSTIIFEIIVTDLIIYNLLSIDELESFYDGDKEAQNSFKIVEYKLYIINFLSSYIFKEDDIKLKPTIDFIFSGTEETYEEFWKEQMETHEFISDELSKSTEETKIRDFAKKEFKKKRDMFIQKTYTLRFYLTKCYDETTKTYNFYQLSDNEYIRFFIALSNFFGILVELNAILVDIYTLARMFKKFELNYSKKSRKTDEPEEPHNIIMYAGDKHSKRVRRFLHETLEFDLISESKGDYNVDFCVDIRNFEQPFFSSWPPKGLLQKMSISDFQITLESRNEIDEDETQLEILIYEGTLTYKGSDTNIMDIKYLATVSITFYSSELIEYHYYTFNSLFRKSKLKSYNVPYEGIIRSSNFIMNSDKIVKKYPFLENFKYIDYFILIVSLQKALDSKIISDSSNIILEVRISSEELNQQKSMIKLLEYYEVIGFEQMFPEDYEKVMENLDVNENNYIPMIGNVKMIMYLFKQHKHKHNFKVAYELLDARMQENSFSVTSAIKKTPIKPVFRKALNEYQKNTLKKYQKKEKSALILCQRKKIISEIYKNDDTQEKINSELERIIKFFLQTESVNIEYMVDSNYYQESDHNMILDKSEPKAEEFVKKHQNFYDLIMLQTCPDEIMDLEYISDILKNEGYIIITKLVDTYISELQTFDLDKYTKFKNKFKHIQVLKDEIKDILTIAIVFQKIQPDIMNLN